ncbi:MAG TPA: PilN domain-containing protein [Candidatus Acidoferrales bacterium]|nr:PilN domain-containing protein [Candidatus Acidoferrales bacterium]
MIRINLLGQTRPRAAKQPVPVEATLRVGMLIAAIAVSLIFLFVTYMSQKKDLDATNDQIQRLETERARLEQVKQQVQQFEAEKAVLQQRINVIELLQKGRTGGQELLDNLANTVAHTDGLWLTNMTKTGNSLTIDGEANSVNSVANFLTQMKRSGFFDKVEIKEAKQDDLLKSVTTFSFSVTADIAAPQSVQAASAPAAAAAPAPRGRS